MEHESNNSGSFAELPQPQETTNKVDTKNNAAVQPETRGMSLPSAPTSQKPPAISPDPQIAQQPPVMPSSAIGVPTNSDSSALIADDADLIEKEWVMRAKVIVAQTKDDPHTQNREMNKVKADYLKKRYNKDLKVSEG